VCDFSTHYCVHLCWLCFINSSHHNLMDFSLLFYKSFSYLLVGILWGCTNPFLKKGSQSSPPTSTHQSNNFGATNGFLANTKRSLKKFLNPRVLFPFILNQSGSLMFYFLLATENISTTVPVCNSLTFIFTGITGWLLGEKFAHPVMFVAGLAMIVSGLSICALSSLED
jgi:drug/metabolite transporter (DMT)-like permease